MKEGQRPSFRSQFSETLRRFSSTIVSSITEPQRIVAEYQTLSEQEQASIYTKRIKEVATELLEVSNARNAFSLEYNEKPLFADQLTYHLANYMTQGNKNYCMQPYDFRLDKRIMTELKDTFPSDLTLILPQGEENIETREYYRALNYAAAHTLRFIGDSLTQKSEVHLFAQDIKKFLTSGERDNLWQETRFAPRFSVPLLTSDKVPQTLINDIARKRAAYRHKS